MKEEQNLIDMTKSELIAGVMASKVSGGSDDYGGYCRYECIQECGYNCFYLCGGISA